jgi:hypothetical protein
VALLKKGEAQEVVRVLGAESDPLARYQVALAGRLDEARAVLEPAVREKHSLSLGRCRARPEHGGTAASRRSGHPARQGEIFQKLGKVQEAREHRQLAAKLP